MDPNTKESDLKDCCKTAYVWKGEASGSETKIGGINTYVARPPSPSDKAVVIFTDVFGWKLINNRILADQYAQQAGCNVFVPDLFQGDEVDVHFMDVTLDPAPSILGRLWQGVKMMATVPSVLLWMRRRTDEKTMADAEKVFEGLRQDEKIKRIGAIGFCWGGRYSILYAATDKIDCYVAAHPSWVKVPQDIEAIQKPGLFVLAEHDPVFKPGMVKQTKEILARRGIEVHYKEYPGTSHGFAVKCNEADAVAVQARDDAVVEVVKFFKSHL